MIRTIPSKRGPTYRVVAIWKNFERVSVTFGPQGRAYDKRDDTPAQAYAAARKFDRLLAMLRQEGRNDVLREIASGKLHPRPLIRMKPAEVLALRVATPDDPTTAIGNAKRSKEKKGEWKESGLLAEFLDYMRDTSSTSRVRRTFAPATIERYRECLSAFVQEWPLGDKTPLTAIDVALIQSAIAAFKKKKRSFSNGTRNRHITALQSFLTWFIRSRNSRRGQGTRIEAWLGTEDWKQLKIREKTGDLSKEVSHAQLDSICENTADQTWRDFWRFLAGTGLRIEEAMNVRVEDLDLASSPPWVGVKEHGAFRPKTDKSTRSVPIHLPGVESVVRSLCNRKREPGDHFLWPPEQRKYRTARNVWATACRGAGLGHERPKWYKPGSIPLTPEQRRGRGLPEIPRGAWAPSVVIHGLRHRYAIDLLNAGVAIHHAKSFLGHGSMAMLDRYTQERDKQSAAKALRETVIAREKADGTHRRGSATTRSRSVGSAGNVPKVSRITNGDKSVKPAKQYKTSS